MSCFSSSIDKRRVECFQSIIYVLTLMNIKVSVHSVTIWEPPQIASPAWNTTKHATRPSVQTTLVWQQFWSLTETKVTDVSFLDNENRSISYPQLQFDAYNVYLDWFASSCLQMFARRWAWSSVSSCEATRRRLFTKASLSRCRLIVFCEGPISADNLRVILFGCCSTISSYSSSPTTGYRRRWFVVQHKTTSFVLHVCWRLPRH